MVIFSFSACGGIAGSEYQAEPYGPQGLGKADNGFGPQVIDESANHETVVLAQGESLTIALEANPSTGYEWGMVAISRGLDLEDQGYTPDQPIAVGSGGTRTFVVSPNFTATPGSSHKVHLAYFRPWEGPSASAKELEVTITVR
jgi:predicted secreted protein